jgi:hypothetical protein
MERQEMNLLAVKIEIKKVKQLGCLMITGILMGFKLLKSCFFG